MPRNAEGRGGAWLSGRSETLGMRLSHILLWGFSKKPVVFRATGNIREANTESGKSRLITDYIPFKTILVSFKFTVANQPHQISSQTGNPSQRFNNE